MKQVPWLLLVLLCLVPLQAHARGLLGDSSETLKLDEDVWRIINNGKKGQDLTEVQKDRDKALKKVVEGHVFEYFETVNYYRKGDGMALMAPLAPGFIIPGATEDLYPQMITVVRVLPERGRGQKAISAEAVFCAPCIDEATPASELDSEPRPRDKPVKIGIPGRSGKAELRILINEHGTVVATDVLESDGPEFSKAARVLAEMTQFTVPKKNGEPVSAALMFPVVFPAN